jgi:hypothetical protein
MLQRFLKNLNPRVLFRRMNEIESEQFSGDRNDIWKGGTQFTSWERDQDRKLSQVVYTFIGSWVLALTPIALLVLILL